MQGHDWIDTRRAPRRNGCRKEGARSQNQGCRAEYRRVITLHTIKLVSEQVTSRQCGRYADGESQAELGQRSAQHQNEHTPAVGAERHAYPDLVGSLRDTISGYAIQPDAGQDQCKHAEEFCEPRDEAFLIKVASHLLGKTHHVENGQIRVGIGKCLADSRLEILGLARNLQFDGTDPAT